MSRTRSTASPWPDPGNRFGSSVGVRGQFHDAVTACVRMAQLVVVRREPAWVTRDAVSGGWRHNFGVGTFVSPLPRGIPWRNAQRKTLDVFCYDYTPQPGDVVVELGAEYGTETVTLSRLVGPTGRVIAVEASPRTFRFLERTVEANRLDNVDLVNAAISDRGGMVTITDAGSLSNRVIREGSESGVHVPASSVDSLVERFGLLRIDLLKMNIEGSERLAMSGMGRSAKLVRHAVISCHDFKAELGKGAEFRTGVDVDRALDEWNFAVLRRPDDVRPWIRDYRYARRVAEQEISPVRLNVASGETDHCHGLRPIVGSAKRPNLDRTGAE